MKPSMKMGAIALIGVFVVFYQYHLSTGVRFDQVADFAAASGPDEPASTSIVEEHDVQTSARRIVTEEMIRAAVTRVQRAHGLSPDIGAELTRELTNQLSRNVNRNSNRRNDSSTDRSSRSDSNGGRNSNANTDRNSDGNGINNGNDNGNVDGNVKSNVYSNSRGNSNDNVNSNSNSHVSSNSNSHVNSNNNVNSNVHSHLTNASNGNDSSTSELDPLYIITPTYRRPEQIPELTRMSHTLMLVRNVHWLVIEDALVATKQVTRLLERTGLKFEHLVAPMPEKYKLKKGAKPRGVSNRNRGLQWIRANATKGVFYFADDDNTYDIALFDEIRKTRRVSMFPVGLCTKFGLSSPVIRNGKFAGFYDGWVAGRKFPVDMAGFAVSVSFLLSRPNATMPFRAGYEEDGFLKSLAPFEPRDVELLADNCTRVLAWHTQTKKNEPSAPLDAKLYGATNLVALKQQIV